MLRHKGKQNTSPFSNEPKGVREMKPRKELSEKQKEVLKSNQFTTNTARECGARGGKKKKENEPKRKAQEAIKKELIEKTYGQIYERLNTGGLSNSELISLFKSVIEISGDKTQKNEVEIPESLFINVINKD